MKKSRSVLGFLVLINAGYTVSVNAQDTTNTIGRVTISSPTAASLGKFGDIPVSYHTGIPQIDVPIYTVESGSLKLPISLSYHASGLKVQENAGWVGAGWALNAGGVVTRTVVGSPDDRGNSNLSNVVAGYYSDYGFNSYLNTAPGSGVPDDINFTRGVKDGEPDLYFFNFGNYSGKFYFNDDRTPIIVPDADFKIQTYFQLGPGFIGFIITTPDGVKYYFGQTGNNGSVTPIETTISSTHANGPATANAASSSWFLNKIMSADGMDSITFNYQTENYSYYTLSLFPIANTDYFPTSSDPKKVGTDLVKNFVSGVRLTQINFFNGKITFTPTASPRIDLAGGTVANSTMQDTANTNSYSLGSISISDNNGFCKKDSFYYGYFFDNTPLYSNVLINYNLTGYNLHTDEYRLRLDSIQETSCDASKKIPPYKFNYFSELVPRRLSSGIDHWGYYNGAYINSILIPTFTVNSSTGTDSVYQGAFRDALWPAMRGGALQQITYPTGGFTSFDFEPKNIDTFYTSTQQPVALTSFVLNYYGQSQITETSNFTIVGTGAYYVTINNYSSNWAPTLSIVNSGGTNVAGTPLLINFLTTYNNTVVLPPGTYTATLSYPSNALGSIIGGATGTIGQWQSVSTPNIQAISGLRIKTITTNDGLTPNSIVTSYNYTGGGSSSTGVLYSIPTYVQIVRNNLMELVWPFCSTNGCETCDGTNVNAHGYFVSPSGIRPMTSVQGENVGYNEVDVSQTGNGHSAYRYYGSNLWNLNITDVCTRVINQSSSCDATIPNFPYPPVPYEFMRDELSYEGHWNQNGQIIKESYHIPIYSLDPLKTPGHIAANLPGLFSYTEYTLQSARKIRDSVSEILHDPVTGNSVTTSNTTYYGSLYHNMPTRVVASTSTVDSLATNTKYAMDFRISTCDAIPDSLSYFNTTVNADSIAMTQNIITCTPQNNLVTNCRQAVFVTYREAIDQARINFIRFRRKYYAADSANSVSNCYLTALSTADTLLKPILRLQNLFQNPTIESTNWKDLNLLHALFVRYDTSSNPIGFAYPGRMKLIDLQTPSSSFTNSAISGITITKDPRYIDEIFYNFIKGNPVQTLGRNGVALSYIWDYSNTKPIAKATNSIIGLIAYTSFESDGKGSWSFTGSSVADATAITGAKDYNLSSGNITASGLDISQKYIVSYWSKTGSATVNATMGTLLISKNGWNYYEHLLSQSSSTVTISGSVTIDELRLYPSTAQMETYTYSPLVGMTTSCDMDNRITYYQYDALGRLSVVKDQDGNIIKTVQYHYQGQ